jgi:hypothetical protein
MRGEFIGVWPDSWRHIWMPLVDQGDVPEDIFCELYRELAPSLKPPLSVEELADIIDDPTQSKVAFAGTTADGIAGERGLVAFLEAACPVLEDLGGDVLTNRYFNLLSGFVDRFNLRYDLRRPCTLCPTLPGMFASLFGDLHDMTISDAYLDGLMNDCEESVRDLRIDCSDRRIKTCIQKEVNLLEAMGARCPGVTSNTIGRICEQVASWPHEKLKEAMKSIYAFTCDYPGIRHAGNPANAIRAIEMRDMVAVSVVLAGFTPYLTDQLDADKIYRGG